MVKLFKKLDEIEDLELRLDILEESIKDFDKEEVSKFLGQYIKYEDKKFASLVAEKNRLRNLGEYEKVTEVKLFIKKVKAYAKLLRNFINETFSEEMEMSGKKNSPRKTFFEILH